jgi:AraC-like DNA-binding protein
MATSIVDVLWTARYDYESGWTLSPHQHAFFQIIYCLGGRGTLTLGGEVHPLAPRTLFLIAPGHSHGLMASTAVKTLDIKFRVREARLRRQLLHMPAVWRRADKGLAHLLERIRHEGELRQAYFRELCAASLLDMLIALVRQHSTRQHAARRQAASDKAKAIRAVRNSIAASGAAGSGAAGSGEDDWLDQQYPTDLPDGALTDAVARRAVRYLHQHYAHPLTLRELSRVLGISERHLRTRVHAALGQSPPRYLAQYRVDRAKDLIAHREFALKDVAARTGFKSIHHFTRTFTRLVGLPPAAWRRAYHDGIRRDVNIDPHFVNDLTPVIGLATWDRDRGRDRDRDRERERDGAGTFRQISRRSRQRLEHP